MFAYLRHAFAATTLCLVEDRVGAGDETVRALSRPSVFNDDILVLDPAELAETFSEFIKSGLEAGLRGAHQQETNPWSPRLGGTCGGRGDHAKDEDDE